MSKKKEKAQKESTVDPKKEKYDQCVLLFNLKDTDKDSCVETKYVEEMCKALGAAVALDQLNDFKDEYTEGKVNFDQFYKFFISQYERKIDKSSLLNAFEFIDQSKTGSISAAELKHALMVIGETTLSEKEADDILKPFINKGKIEYKKLVAELAK